MASTNQTFAEEEETVIFKWFCFPKNFDKFSRGNRTEVYEELAALLIVSGASPLGVTRTPKDVMEGIKALNEKSGYIFASPPLSRECIHTFVTFWVFICINLLYIAAATIPIDGDENDGGRSRSDEGHGFSFPSIVQQALLATPSRLNLLQEGHLEEVVEEVEELKSMFLRGDGSERSNQ